LLRQRHNAVLGLRPQTNLSLRAGPRTNLSLRTGFGLWFDFGVQRFRSRDMDYTLIQVYRHCHLTNSTNWVHLMAK